MVSGIQILENFPELVSYVAGDKYTSAIKPCSYENPCDQGLVYLPNAKGFDAVATSSASIVVLPEGLAHQFDGYSRKKLILSSRQLQVAMAKINQTFFPVTADKEPFDGHKIHPSAIISETAKLGANVIIGPLSVIGPGATIKDDCVIGPHCTIEAGAIIGARTHLYAQVFIAHDCQIGSDCEIHPNSSVGTPGYGYATDSSGTHHTKPHYGRVIIQDRVRVGAGVHIDRGAYDDSVIGAGTKIDNYCHLGHNAKIGKNCLITAGFISAGSATIGDNCVFGGRSSVNGHIEIASNCMFGGLTGIVNNVPKPGKYAGFPVMPYKDSLKAYATFVQLPKMRKNLSLLMKKVGIEE